MIQNVRGKKLKKLTSKIGGQPDEEREEKICASFNWNTTEN